MSWNTALQWFVICGGAYLVYKAVSGFKDWGEDVAGGLPDELFSWMFPEQLDSASVLAYIFTRKLVSLGQIPPAPYAGVPPAWADDFVSWYGEFLAWINQAHRLFYLLNLKGGDIWAGIVKSDGNRLIDYAAERYGESWRAPEIP